ncbi:MAG: DUF86 domain-containing protein [Bacillota bacterium]|nr:DUF86 domain-containing protein [Bacillota bacterium]
MPGLDVDRVSKHLEDISVSLRILETFRSTPFDLFAADPRIHWAVEKGLERCIQNVLDVSAHILASIGGPVPDDYASLLLELGKRRVLSPEFASRISPMAGFRNILVHRYLDVDLREVHGALENRLDDFRAFAGHVLQFLDINR